jgi:hypothetical protein
MRLRRGNREDPEVAEAVAALVGLITRFLDGEMDAATFDVQYRRSFQARPPGWGTPTYDALEWLAFECNEYVDVPELREPGDVDDEALAAAARKTLADLRELGVA